MEETLTLIKKAIRELKTISFTYDKSDKAAGTRFGNPHAVYRVSGRSGRVSIKVHIVQTGGASDSKNLSSKANFLVFDLKHINNIQVSGKASFAIDPRYNPNLGAYHNSIQKI